MFGFDKRQYLHKTSQFNRFENYLLFNVDLKVTFRCAMVFCLSL